MGKPAEPPAATSYKLIVGESDMVRTVYGEGYSGIREIDSSNACFIDVGHHYPNWYVGNLEVGGLKIATVGHYELSNGNAIDARIRAIFVVILACRRSDYQSS